MSNKSAPQKSKTNTTDSKSKQQHITKISAQSSAKSTIKDQQEASLVASEPKVKADQKDKTNHETDVSRENNPQHTAHLRPKLKHAEHRKSLKRQKRVQKDQHEKTLREVFILARPFVAIGRYLRDSWRELRQVRWPNRSKAWKMTFAVLAYCAIFIIFITLLDSLFTFIFNLLLGQS